MTEAVRYCLFRLTKHYRLLDLTFLSLFSSLYVLMRAFFRRFFGLSKKSGHSHKSSSNSQTMSSSATVAALYAATISSASVTGAQPEDAKDKTHHLKDGKGFNNPWVSNGLHNLIMKSC